MRAVVPYIGRGAAKVSLATVVVACLVFCATGLAQTCTTQAKLSAQERTEVGTAAFKLATAVQAADNGTLREATLAQYADSNQTAYLVRTTSERLAGDALAVSQVYLLDATSRKQNDSSDAEFTCPLAGTLSETDFSISGLPPGRYAFAMVEAQGPSPWLLAFLLQHQPSGWKMAGFYPHQRTAGGHDGLWYWTAARADAKANRPWLAWLRYGEADQLLRPANFVSSGNLDKLRSEQRSAAPEPLGTGLSEANPLVLTGAGSTAFRVTSLSGQGSENGKQVNLLVHLQAEPATDANAATQRSLAAASALLTAHPEIRQGFDNVVVIAEANGTNPLIVQRPIAELAGGR